MKESLKSNTLSIGLAIFSMFFGAGNLMYPLKVGMESGNLTVIGMLGFLLTGVLLPLAGLVGMILFDGNYQAFFTRLGRIPGSILIFLCMLVIGPLLAIPRIITLSHIMIAPLLPAAFGAITPWTSFIFACLFLGVTFFNTYRENKIVTILGYVISPLLLFSLLFIILKGFIHATHITHATYGAWKTFVTNIYRGYATLDLLGAIFFSSIILNILKNTMGPLYESNPRLRAFTGLKAGFLGLALLAFVYVGLGILGAYHGHDLASLNEGQLFQTIAFNVMDHYGALVIGTAVLMACLSTSIALCAVVAEYLQYEIFRNTINYASSLIIVMLLCIPLSIAGLDEVLSITGGPLIYIGYPVLIALTFCNIAYKLFQVRAVQIPVFLTLIASISLYMLRG